jgi:hypothetical protein
MKNKKGEGMVAIIAVLAIAVVVIGFLAQQGTISIPGFGKGSVIEQEVSEDTPPSVISGQCEVAPAYTYSGYDSLNGLTIGGTVQAKIGDKAPGSSTNPPAGSVIQLWLQNSTGHLCGLSEKVKADCGNQDLEVDCFDNATVTTAVYDEPAHTALTATTTTGTGATNISIGANGLGTMSLTYQANAKQSFLPFGGCLAIEVPNTITQITATGAGISEGCPYQWTYTTASTSNIYKLFSVPSGFDADGKGDVKTINIQLQNGGTDITAGNMVVTMRQANYYVGNDKNFYLDVEQKMKGLNTVTGDEIVSAVAIS